MFFILFNYGIVSFSLLHMLPVSHVTLDRVCQVFNTIWRSVLLSVFRGGFCEDAIFDPVCRIACEEEATIKDGLRAEVPVCGKKFGSVMYSSIYGRVIY